MQKLTVISHFYNEEYLLPFWLKHHTRLFDHGILIDYDSTDKSVEIIKQYAPNWEIVKSRNQYFHRELIDPEVVEIERRVDGWKTALNITEFIFHPDLRAYLSNLDPSVNGVWLPPITMIDEDIEQVPLSTELPLLLQKAYGVIGKNELRPTNRLIHRKRHGEYKGEGRHASYMDKTFLAGDIFYCWFGWCPWNKDFLKRKLQIQDKMTDEYKSGYGLEKSQPHIITKVELLNKFKNIKEKYMSNLHEDYIYSFLFNEIGKSYSDKEYRFPTGLICGEEQYNLTKLSSLLKSLSYEYFRIFKPPKRKEVYPSVHSIDNDTVKGEEFLYYVLKFTANWVKNAVGRVGIRMAVTKDDKIIVDSSHLPPNEFGGPHA